VIPAQIVQSKVIPETKVTQVPELKVTPVQTVLFKATLELKVTLE
jgi:hypothetical protein